MVTEVLEQYHRSLEAFVKGIPLHRSASGDAVTLAHPLGPPARGWSDVSSVFRRAASQLSDGDILGFERISEYSNADLAYILEIERARVKVGAASEPTPTSLRVTTIFRREDHWKIVHRHADPITSPRPIESLIEEKRNPAHRLRFR